MDHQAHDEEPQGPQQLHHQQQDVLGWGFGNHDPQQQDDQDNMNNNPVNHWLGDLNVHANVINHDDDMHPNALDLFHDHQDENNNDPQDHHGAAMPHPFMDLAAPPEDMQIGADFLSSHLPQHADSTMLLSHDEQRLAYEIQGAVQVSPSLTRLSDFQYAHYAVVCHVKDHGNVMTCLQRITLLQEFQRVYQIDDTPQQGLQCFQRLMEQLPNWILDVEVNDQTQEAVLVCDMRAFSPQKALADAPTFLRGWYYLMVATQPSVAALRQGLFWILDCDGMCQENVCEAFDAQWHYEFLSFMPVLYKKGMAYGANATACTWWASCKRYWQAAGLWNQLEVGCKLTEPDASKPPRRFSELYLPSTDSNSNVTAAKDKILRRVQQLLQVRHANELGYRLPPSQQ